MKIIAIVQARMNSARLPGKVMLEAAGKPLIGHLVDRLRQCKELNGIVVAGPECDRQSQLAEYLKAQKITAFFGEAEDDLCARFLAVIRWYPCDAFVRICGDSPLIEPAQVDGAVKQLRGGDPFVSNVGLKTVPPGNSVEGCDVYFYKHICDICQPEDQEHAGFPAIYRSLAMQSTLVDTQEDFARVKALIERGGPGWPENGPSHD